MTSRPLVRRRLALRAGLAAVTVGALAACSSAGATPAASPSASPSALVLDNCGTTVTVTTPPQRVVTIKSSTTEMLLSLGLAGRMVGTAFADGPLPTDLAAAGAGVPVLSDQVPGQEALLAVQPDFVVAGWESNLSADGAGDRTALAKLGIGSYVSPAACKEPGYMPDPLTFDDVFAEIRQVGAIFGVPAAADQVVAAEQATLAGVHKPAGTTTALWYSSGSDSPYVGAGIGAPQMIMDAAGLTNVFAAVHDTWTSVGWEDVVAADPDVIVLVDASWNTAAHKIALLEANPATAQLRAVQQHRYLTVPFAASEAGVRNADAVASLVTQLDALPAR
jgi:iron complex transport system substrate-binding protein